MRTGELDEVNDFLESMLISQRGGLVVIDRDLRISVWNDKSAELWGLRPDEAPGQHFLNLDIGFPLEKLRTPTRNCLAGRSEREQVVQQAVNRRGRAIDCTVSISCLTGNGVTRGVILMMDAVPRDGAAQPADGRSAVAQETTRRGV